MTRPALSVVVVVYDMEREARRSLLSLSPTYQRGVSAGSYEVIVVDNGSPRPFNRGSVAEFGPNVTYHYLADANRSPARAMNLGVRLARSDYLALMIDGARVLTPGILRYGLWLPHLFRRPCGLVMGFHLGPDLQSRSLVHGYDHTQEDELLAAIDWPTNPYRLFEIGSPHDPSDGWFRLVGESNFTFVHRDVLERVGGFDERYLAVGGGHVNLDVQTAIYEQPDVDLVMLIGEGTFHQFHRGATSGQPPRAVDALVASFDAEYRAIRGREFDPETQRRPHYVGHVPPEAEGLLTRFVHSSNAELHESRRVIRHLHGEVARRDRMIEDLHAEQAASQASLRSLHRELAARDPATGGSGARADSGDPVNAVPATGGEASPASPGAERAHRRWEKSVP